MLAHFPGFGARLLGMDRILYAADCLDILNDEAELPDESIDLIYLDPPFNSNSNYNLPFKGRDKSLNSVEAFTDTWEWTTSEYQDCLWSRLCQRIGTCIRQN